MKNGIIVDVDMIGFTFGLPESRREDTKNKLYEFRTPAGKRLNCTNNMSRYGNGFYERYTGAKFGVYPINKKHHFLKVEVNPNPDKKGVEKAVKKVIHILKETVGEDVHQLIQASSRVTRLDLCIDVNEAIPESYIYLSKARASKIILGKNEGADTQYAGSPSSDLQVKVYDKDEEQQSKGLPSDGPKTRLELTIRDIGVPLNQLDDQVAKHFNKVTFYDSSLLADKELSKMFRKCCKKNGLNHAMAELMKNTGDRNKKRRYETILQRYEIDPFGIENVNLKVNWKPLKPFLE
jgi:hypothetical protein